MLSIFLLFRNLLGDAHRGQKGSGCRYSRALVRVCVGAHTFAGKGSFPTRLYWYYEEDKAISELFINEQIRDKEVRVMAEEAGLDLVKIAPTAKPPVCKIVDYGKFRYEQARKEKEARKKQKIIEIKEIRLSPNIDTNDLNTKMNAARKFISKGDKVKITLRFRGREMAHMANSKHILDDFAEALSDIASIEKAPKVEGRSMTMFLTEKR